MGHREDNAIRRELVADIKAWPAALLIVAIYLVLANGQPPAPDAMTEAPPGLGAYSEQDAQP